MTFKVKTLILKVRLGASHSRVTSGECASRSRVTSGECSSHSGVTSGESLANDEYQLCECQCGSISVCTRLFMFWLYRYLNVRFYTKHFPKNSWLCALSHVLIIENCFKRLRCERTYTIIIIDVDFASSKL